MSAADAASLDELAERVADRVAGLLNGSAGLTPLLDAEEAGQLLNVPARWLRDRARHGAIPHRRFGRYIRFDRDELLSWAEAQRHER